ncbi:hypothetical protein KC901_00230, partial [Patescibacteria group bacterium]|nr:hypothetical protein [Patescibacteria group bacterium]
MGKALRFFIVISLLSLVLTINVPRVFSATTSWNFSVPGDYTVSDANKINLNGDVAMLTVTG